MRATAGSDHQWLSWLCIYPLTQSNRTQKGTPATLGPVVAAVEVAIKSMPKTLAEESWRANINIFDSGQQRG
jgi:hypothetical protein